MDSKFLILSVFFALNVAFSGEKNLTGNFQWDILNIKNDSVSAGNSILVQPVEHQNPFINGLYSLVIPGAGQYQSERYTKAAIFLSAEVALIAYAIISNNSGDKKTAEFQRYAEAHWSAERYAKWINVYGVSDYGPGLTTSIDLNKVRLFDFTEINDWERGLHKEGFSHTLPKYPEQQYYELIGKYHQFKYGWDTYPDANNDGTPDSDGGIVDAMIPQQLKDYAKERGKANDYYYAASFAVSVLVVNHALSAIDAFISTKSYNSEISASLNLKPVDGIEGKRLLSELTLHVGF